ncbi:MAG: hypothetical protein ACTSWF_13305, partial [Candidatus Freyarchaeota archaeon]
MQAQNRIRRTLKIILDAGYQITPEALKAFSLYENPEGVAKELISKIEETSEDVITIDHKHINELYNKKKETTSEPEETENIEAKDVRAEITTETATLETQEPSQISKKPEFYTSNQLVLTQSPKRFLAKDIDARLEVIFDPTGRMKGKGTLENFIEYFRDRYMRIYNIFLRRGDIENISKLSEITNSREKQARVIGIVTSIQKTKSGHVIIELEDLESTIKAIIYESNSEVIRKAEYLMLDQVICLDGHTSKNMF